ncbi:MAG: alkaline phosphatase family protein [Actinomycetota bacterium]
MSITDQIDSAGKTWRGYMDEMSTPCKHPAPDTTTSPFHADPYQSGYATRHDPFVYYPSIAGRQSYCDQHVVDYSALGSDLASESTTPNYAFIAPDTCHDGHDSPCTGSDAFDPGGGQGGLVTANLWMSTEVPKILASPAFTTPGVSSVLLITTDESANTDVFGCLEGSSINVPPGTCASGIPPVGVDGGGDVGLLAIGSPAANLQAAGTQTATQYDHVSMLRTIEDGLRLPSLANPLVAQDSEGHINEAASPLEHSMSTLFS